MAPGDVHALDADLPGWRNLIVVITGGLTATLGATRFEIGAGGFRVFPGAAPHRYANEGDRRLRFVRNVVH